jgi:hypothetical protein
LSSTITGAPVEAAVVHYQIDPIARQNLVQLLQPAGIIVVAVEQLELVEHVLRQGVEIGTELGRILDLLLQPGTDLLQFAIQQRLDHPAPQHRQGFVHRALERLGCLHVAGDLRTQLLLGDLDRRAPALRQRQYLVLGQPLALLAGEGEDHAPAVVV